ncbi:MAG: TolC family protein [Candidatus Hydrogenedentes bacterium]|nr:TolC family protein [Candidatus Hydrogenedentota bacterium]
MKFVPPHTPVIACFVLALTGCVHSPTTWTPESVSPPPPAATAIEVPAPLESSAAPVALPQPGAEAMSVPLTRDGAILTGLSHNRAIEVASYGPAIDATFIDEARADFDPRLLASVSRGRERSQSFGNTGSNSNTLQEETAKAITVDSVEDLLARVQSLNQTLETLRGGSGNTAMGSTGSIRVQQYLPTGTMLFLTGSHAEIDDGPSQGSWTLGVTQPLLRGANPSANLATLRQARNAAAQSEHAFRMTVLDVIQQIERAYWELVLAEEVLGIRELGVTLAEEQLHREEELLAVGKALNGDVMSARAEHAARRADLVDAQAAMKRQAIELTHLMRPEVFPRWDVLFDPQDGAQVVEVHADAAQSEELSLQYRPELAQARLTLANLELEEARTRNGRLPQLNLVGEYRAVNDNPTATSSTSLGANEDTYSVGLEFETALTRRAERARYLRAQLERDRGAGYIAQLEEGIAAEVRQAIVEATRQWERLTATAEAVLSSGEAARVIEARHEVGRATNLDVLQVQRDFIQAQVDDATARVRYIEALTTLYAAEGTLLERRGISMAGLAGRNEQRGSSIHEVD